MSAGPFTSLAWQQDMVLGQSSDHDSPWFQRPELVSYGNPDLCVGTSVRKQSRTSVSSQVLISRDRSHKRDQFAGRISNPEPRIASRFRGIFDSPLSEHHAPASAGR